MARLERFHTFEAEVSGQLNEKVANEAKVQHLSLEIENLETTHPRNRMHEVEIAERLKALKRTRMEYKDCSTQYLLDVIPHIRAYSECCKIMSETPIIGTPQRYTMGSVYKNYQKQYNRKDNFGSTSQTCDMPRCALGICDRCHHSNMIFDSVTSTNVCEECGNSVNVIMNETVNATFGQTGIVQTKYAYKRINHFNEWLNTFQAKETTLIEEHVVDTIRQEFKKNRYTEPEDVTTQRVREYLKLNKFNKFYEHSSQIASVISGIPAVSISKIQEHRLRTMFQIIQKPFETVCPKDRKNFPSYAFILHKFCELLSYDDIIHMFPLLKSREKLFQLDNIWKDICLDLKWEFIPSI